MNMKSRYIVIYDWMINEVGLEFGSDELLVYAIMYTETNGLVPYYDIKGLCSWLQKDEDYVMRLLDKMSDDGPLHKIPPTKQSPFVRFFTMLPLNLR